MKTVIIVEDDPDIQSLIEVIFSMDSRFAVARPVESAEDAIEVVRTTGAEIIVLDYGLPGDLTGLDAARQLKQLAPQAKIIMFTAHAEIEAEFEKEPTIDAFLLKTDTTRLLPLAQLMTRMLGFA